MTEPVTFSPYGVSRVLVWASPQAENPGKFLMNVSDVLQKACDNELLKQEEGSEIIPEIRRRMGFATTLMAELDEEILKMHGL